MSARRLTGVALVMLAVACAGLALTSAPALAGLTHKYLRQLTGATFGSVNGIAVGDGNVWVVDEKNKVVDEFSASSGTYEGRLTGAGVTGIGTFGNVLAVATDSTGNVWVSDNTNKVVDEFSAPGTTFKENYVGRLTGAGVTGIGPFGTRIAGLAVDSSRNVWVSDGSNKVVDEFSAPGTPFKENYVGQLTGAGVTGLSEFGRFGKRTNGLAVDSSKNVWVGDATDKVVDEFSAPGTPFKENYVGQLTGAGVTGIGTFGSVTAVAAASSGDVLVADGTRLVVDEFSESGTPFAENYIDRLTGAQTPAKKFGVIGVPALAVDSTGNVWVGDEVGKVVDELGPLVNVPEVLTGAASKESATSATLAGAVNPDQGVPLNEVIDAYAIFEYGPCGATLATCTSSLYPQKATAVTEVGQNADFGSGSSFVNGEAAVGGLQPNKFYHYRIVGENTNGTSEPGAERTFKTLAVKPVIEGQQALFVTLMTAELAGVVNPENEATTMKFEYGPCADAQSCATSPYSSETVSASVGEGFGGVTLYSEVEALTPATTYHYRVVAKNLTGTTGSAEGTFATPAIPPTVTPPAGSAPQAVAATPTDIGTSTATLNGQVSPNDAPTSYRIVLALGGPTAASAIVALGEAGSGSDAVPVSLTVESLQPGTEYTYWLIATNASGSSTSSAQSFTTSGMPAAFTQPLAPALLAVPSFPAVTIGKAIKRASCRAKGKRIKNANKRKRALQRCAKTKRKSVH
jgi:hypothetical protein